MCCLNICWFDSAHSDTSLIVVDSHGIVVYFQPSHQAIVYTQFGRQHMAQQEKSIIIMAL
jgi:hypothetical protein